VNVLPFAVVHLCAGLRRESCVCLPVVDPSFHATLPQQISDYFNKTPDLNLAATSLLALLGPQHPRSALCSFRHLYKTRHRANTSPIAANKMVQYKPEGGYPVTSDIHHNSYWKLGSYQLPMGYVGRPLTTAEWMGRDQRSLLRYRDYSLPELLRFLDTRQIRRPYLIGTAGKAVVMSILENADDRAIFMRFLELPAELRVKIYKYHLDDIAFNVSSSLHQPPITLAS